MKEKEFNDRFFDLEESHDVFHIRYCGVPVWERIRFNAFQTIKRGATDIQEAHTRQKRDGYAYVQGMKLWAKNAVFKNPYLTGKHNFLFYGHSRRKLLEDGKWWDIYCDPIFNSTELDYLHIEEPYLMGHKSPAKTENLRYVDFIQFTGAIRRNLGLSEVQLTGEARDRLQEFADAIQREFGVEIDLVRSAEIKLTRRDSVLDLYKLFLSRVDPKVVLVVVSYGKHTFLEACHELGIPTVELQHGTPQTKHPGYSFPESVNKETFPDYFFAFGEFWKNKIDFPIPDDHVITVGYPHLEQRVQKYNHLDRKEQILFLSQGTIGEQLSRFAVEMAQDPEIDHEIVYKLHPGEYERWREAYPWLIDKDITVIDESEPPLYRLFAESSVQIGVYSTAVYEGLCFDLETYLYDCSGVEDLQILIDEDVAKLVSSVEEFKTNLSSEAGKFDPEKFFASNATETLVTELQKIVAQSR